MTHESTAYEAPAMAEAPYEAPVLVQVGDFSDLTRGAAGPWDEQFWFLG